VLVVCLWAKTADAEAIPAAITVLPDKTIAVETLRTTMQWGFGLDIAMKAAVTRADAAVVVAADADRSSAVACEVGVKLAGHLAVDHLVVVAETLPAIADVLDTLPAVAVVKRLRDPAANLRAYEAAVVTADAS
jgi:predicted Kef-type K+ transport protein